MISAFPIQDKMSVCQNTQCFSVKSTGTWNVEKTRWMYLLCVAIFNCWSNKILYKLTVTQPVHLCSVPRSQQRDVGVYFMTWQFDTLCVPALAVRVCLPKESEVRVTCWPTEQQTFRDFPQKLHEITYCTVYFSEAITNRLTAANRSQFKTQIQFKSQLLSRKTQNLAHETFSRPSHYLHTPQNPGLWQKMMTEDRQTVFELKILLWIYIWRKGSEGRDATEN
jgi:hypothetical protein